MIILIDNYDSFTYNLVHYFQELGQKVVVYRNDERTCEQILNEKCKYIVISPGPSEPKKSGICLELIKENSKTLKPIPMIGVCLGHQAIAEAFNGSVIQSGDPVHGKVSKIEHDDSELFQGIRNPFNATRYHSLIVEKKSLPNCFDIISMTESGIIMGIKHKKFPFYGVQFHPESIATEFGHKLLENFLKVFK
ncbi:aminodeoxychorismate/anthranilate synthase component II [Rickettsiales bacterium]|nr:aminodeoxychorismate/anthranilate synthase component II [Rickettsiales bacterium]